jgi:ligand-binding sensor domain-containing protein
MMSKSSRGLSGHWSYFTSDNSPLPVNSLVTRCVSSRQNQVWIDVWVSQGIGVPAEQYGLFLTDGSNWSEYRLGEHGLPVKTVEHTAMATDSNNRLWFSVYNLGLCCFDGQSTIVYEYGQPGFLTKGMYITDLYVDKLDRVWAATLAHGMYKLLPSNEWEKVVSEAEGVLSDRILTFGVDWESNLWVACSDTNETRFLSNRSGTWELVCSFPLGLKDADEVTCFAIDRNDDIWVGRQRGGLMVWNGKSWKRLTEEDCSILYGDIRSLAIDEYDNLWVSPGGGGLAVFDGVEWHAWAAAWPESKQQPVRREVLLGDSSDPETGYVRIGGYVAVDDMGRKWIPASTGVVVFSPE